MPPRGWEKSMKKLCGLQGKDTTAKCATKIAHWKIRCVRRAKEHAVQILAIQPTQAQVQDAFVLYGGVNQLWFVSLLLWVLGFLLWLLLQLLHKLANCLCRLHNNDNARHRANQRQHGK